MSKQEHNNIVQVFQNGNRAYVGALAHAKLKKLVEMLSPVMERYKVEIDLAQLKRETANEEHNRQSQSYFEAERAYQRRNRLVVWFKRIKKPKKEDFVKQPWKELDFEARCKATRVEEYGYLSHAIKTYSGDPELFVFVDTERGVERLIGVLNEELVKSK